MHCYLSRIKKQHLFTCIFQMYITIIELRCYEDNCIWYTFDFKGTTQNTSMDFIVFIVFNQTCLERNNCNVYSKYEDIYQDSICRRFLKKKMFWFCRQLQIFKVHPVLLKTSMCQIINSTCHVSISFLLKPQYWPKFSRNNLL